MGRRLAWPLVAVGVLVAVLGAAVMVVLGPDSRFTTGPHAVDTDGIAVVTAPGVVSWSGLQVDVLAEVPVNKPVFVGVGNAVDVEDYVAETQRLEVTSFRVPWTPQAREVEGRPALPAAPTALDWWLADSAGLGGAAVTTTLPDEAVSVAILAVGSTNLSGLQVSFAYGLRGGFVLGAGLLLGGVGVATSGLLLRRRPVADEDDLVEVEEVVYVYVDEDGVEHEISAEEAARIEAGLPTDEEPGREGSADAATPAREVPEREASAARAWATAGVLTAADVVAGLDEPPAPVRPEDPPAEERAVVEAAPPEDAPVDDPGPEGLGDDPSPPQESVVYVFVDEDGVEHEVAADRLHEFEVVDDEEEQR